jgi:hypothetical protein
MDDVLSTLAGSSLAGSSQRFTDQLFWLIGDSREAMTNLYRQ